MDTLNVLQCTAKCINVKNVNAEFWNFVHTVTPKKLILSMASRIICPISWSVTVKLRWMLYRSLYFTVSMTLVKTLAITHVPSYAKPWNLLAPRCFNCRLLSYSLLYSWGVWAKTIYSIQRYSITRQIQQQMLCKWQNQPYRCSYLL